MGCFSIKAILSSSSKRQRVDDEVKEERPESPTSTTSDLSLPLLTTTTSPTKLSPSPSPSPPASLSPSPKFPLWTQCQRDARRARRPYSRHTVALLSWWFHHLPFLAMEEMETVAWLAALTRQQVKVWWQNRRHHTAPERCQPEKFATLSFSAFLVVCDQDKKLQIGQQIL